MAQLIHRFVKISVLLVLMLPSTWVSATEEPRLVSLDVGFFSPFRPGPPPLFFRSEDGFEPVVFPRAMRGETVRYEGPENMAFYTRRKTEEGVFDYEQVAEVLLPDGLIEPLLVFNVRLKSNDELEIRVLPMEVHDDHFPRSSLAMVNLTSITMIGKVGERQVQVRPGVTAPVAFAENGIFQIGLAFEFDNQIYPTFHNTVTLDPETRQWMFIGTPRRPGSVRVRVRFIEDHALLQQSPEL